MTDSASRIPPRARAFLAYLADFGPDEWLELPTIAVLPEPNPYAPGGTVAAIARRDTAFRGLYGGVAEKRAIEDAVAELAQRIRLQLLASDLTKPPLRTIAEADVLCQWAATALVVRPVLGPAYFPLLYRVNDRIPLLLVDPDSPDEASSDPSDPSPSPTP